MTYFQSLEEVREWVLLNEPDIDTAYATMVAIKALWNDGYNEAFVDAAVPIGQAPPRGDGGEDAGDLSVATEDLREEPPDYSTESRDPPYGLVAYDEAPSEVPPPPPPGSAMEAIADRLEPHYFHRLRLSPWAIKMKLILFARGSTFEPYEPQQRPIHWPTPTIPFIKLIESIVVNERNNLIQGVYDSLDYRTRVLGERPEDIENEEEPNEHGLFPPGFFV